MKETDTPTRGTFNHQLLRGLLATLVLAVIYVVGAVVIFEYPGEDITPAGLERNTATYIEMRDGVRIAIDLWLPESLGPTEKIPALMHMTRYWRAKERGLLARPLDALGFNIARSVPDAIRTYNAAGYAYVQVDARGTGASFGNREAEWGPEEIRDYGEVAEWISRQSWSNGRVGTTGVSYAGNTAELTATTQHQALKAVAPLYSDYDPQYNLVQPGGVKMAMGDKWARTVSAMDRNDICAVAREYAWDSSDVPNCFLSRLISRGAKPVDGSDGRALLRQAVETRENIDVLEVSRTVNARDDNMASSKLTMRDISPYGLQDKIQQSQVAMFVRTGWLDAGTSDGALQRFLELDNPQQVVIGAYSHGGRFDVDPLAAIDRSPEPSLPKQFEQLIRFFDCHLKDIESATCAAPNDKQIHYFTMGERRWRTTSVWPPEGIYRQTLYFDKAGTLTTHQPQCIDGVDVHTPDYTHSTGNSTRWHTNLGGSDVLYPNRNSESRKLLAYESGPLEEKLRITGTPVVTLQLQSNHPEGAVHVYLETVSPRGDIIYLTEGILNFAHRYLESSEIGFQTGIDRVRPFLRSYRKDMPTDLPQTLKIPLFSTSVEIPRGYKIRVALAGTDRSMFERIPEQGSTQWQIFRQQGTNSQIELPVASEQLSLK